MFCTSCGNKIPDNANFCVGCGAQANRPAPPYVPPIAPEAPPPPIAVAPPIPATVIPTPPAQVHKAATHGATVKCSWCFEVVDASTGSCPKCGAELDVAAVTSASGWIEVPGRKDMAKVQFGNSSCQIEGVYVPVADMNLAAGDSIYFTHHVLLWKDPHVNVTAMSMKGAWKRMFAGLPLVMTQAAGPGHIAFSKDDPGELMPMPLEPGQAIDVREHLFLAATSNVEYDWFQTNVWFKTQNGNDTETHYPIGMFMDRFSSAATPGLLLLHAGGNVFTRVLAPGETILVKPTALVFKDPAVQMHLHFEHPRTGFTSWGYWSNRYLWLRLTGPGRVGIQSVFERIEGESRNISGFSYATEQRW